MKYICGIAALMLTACSNGGPTAPLDREFRIAVGETVSIAGTDIEVTFVRVAQDSRCPFGALCVQSVQAGNAQIEVDVTQHGAPTIVALNTATGPQFADVGSYVIALSALTPYPAVGQPASTKDYRATLAVEAR